MPDQPSSTTTTPTPPSKTISSTNPQFLTLLLMIDGLNIKRAQVAEQSLAIKRTTTTTLPESELAKYKEDTVELTRLVKEARRLSRDIEGDLTEDDKELISERMRVR
ncbi:hypothetical protein MMC09_004174 [Bachmanniomyces sp. S44760]|nr:hypothetical protein [Bachmanniomyces sp. S44760]